jgi:polyhydroxybutyrate depolymerase
VTIELLKISGGGHTWPGAAAWLPGTNYDIDASEQIWNFFAKYDINGPVDSG